MKLKYSQRRNAKIWMIGATSLTLNVLLYQAVQSSVVTPSPSHELDASQAIRETVARYQIIHREPHLSIDGVHRLNSEYAVARSMSSSQTLGNGRKYYCLAKDNIRWHVFKSDEQYPYTDGCGPSDRKFIEEILFPERVKHNK